MGLKTMTIDSIKVAVSDQQSFKGKTAILDDLIKVETHNSMTSTSNDHDDFIQVGGKKKKEIIKNSDKSNKQNNTNSKRSRNN